MLDACGLLTQECTSHLRRRLLNAIAGVATPRPYFEFSRFEVAVDRDNVTTVLEDAFDAREAGVQCIPLTEFTKASAGAPA